jgi:hypothetical protein
MTTTTAMYPDSLTIPNAETLSGHQLYIEAIHPHELPENLQEKARDFSQFYAVRNHDAAGMAFFYLATTPTEVARKGGFKRGDKAILYRNGRRYISGVTCRPITMAKLAYFGQQFGWLCTID